MKKEKWAIVGLGYISQRHIQAIHDIGDILLMGCDCEPQKAIKLPEKVAFYSSWEEMIDHPTFAKVDNVAICTPNYLHVPMILACRQRGKLSLCEKPLALTSKDIERINFPNIFTVLQLRANSHLQKFKNDVYYNKKHYNGVLSLNLNRGQFYLDGWQGDVSKSGGLLFNIGIHYFDLLSWFFGELKDSQLLKYEKDNAEGLLHFDRAIIRWDISLKAARDFQWRRLLLNDGTKTYNFDLSEHFEDLHTRVYRDMKRGLGTMPKEANRAISLIEALLSQWTTSSLPTPLSRTMSP